MNYSRSFLMYQLAPPPQAETILTQTVFYYRVPGRRSFSAGVPMVGLEPTSQVFQTSAVTILATLAFLYFTLEHGALEVQRKISGARQRQAPEDSYTQQRNRLVLANMDKFNPKLFLNILMVLSQG